MYRRKCVFCKIFWYHKHQRTSCKINYGSVYKRQLTIVVIYLDAVLLPLVANNCNSMERLVKNLIGCKGQYTLATCR